MEHRQRVMGFAVEGLVIVASILLAFAIDALWDRHLERTRTHEYLTALEDEFRAARNEMIDQIGDHRAQLAAVDELLAGFADGRPEDYLLPRMPWLNALYVYGPAHPVFQDLANAGAIDILESSELRYALLNYGQSTAFLTALAEREAELWHRFMHPYLIERTDILRQTRQGDRGGLTPRFPSGIDSLYQDRTFQNLLLRRKRSISSQLRVNGDVLDAIDAVLLQIAEARRL